MIAFLPSISLLALGPRLSNEAMGTSGPRVPFLSFGAIVTQVPLGAFLSFYSCRTNASFVSLGTKTTYNEKVK